MLLLNTLFAGLLEFCCHLFNLYKSVVYIDSGAKFVDKVFLSIFVNLLYFRL